jgi:hypothetical protein
LWAYRSSYTTQFGQLQPAPLFMALEPAVYRPETPANWITGALVGAAFTLAIGVIAIVAFWYRRSDQPAEAARKQAASPPDFRGLE